MNSGAYWYILLASISGGLGGVLVMWNRKRAQISGPNTVRRCAVLFSGTAASASALFFFNKAFAEQPNAYAAIVVIVMTAWVAVVRSVLQLRLPRFVLRVRTGEFAILRARWTGVRLFGRLLRITPLRHLGGRVYLSDVGRNALAVLRGIYEAEEVHFWALLLSCPWLGLWGMQGRWMAVVCGVAVHIPLNVYPLLHLRYVTGKIEQHVARARRSAAA